VGISVDLDPVSHYVHCRGWELGPHTNPNAVCEEALPRFLDILDQLQIKATFFVVGTDLEVARSRAALARAAAAGHELANHTYHHRLDFYRLPGAHREEEIATAEILLRDLTGRPVRGFRSPGWNLDPGVLDILERRGYSYDATVVPGPWSHGLRVVQALWDPMPDLENFAGQSWLPWSPDSPYRPGQGPSCKGEERHIVEIPGAVTPGLRLPWYGTARLALGRSYFRLATATIAREDKVASYVFHGLELVDYARDIRDPRLLVKPGLQFSMEEKTRIVRETLVTLQDRFDLCPLEQIASDFVARNPVGEAS